MRDRLTRVAAPLTGLTTLALASPALAQDFGTSDDAGAIVCGSWICVGLSLVVGLAFTVFWVWMLVDAIQRQEHEYPNSSGNSKIMWILLIVLVNISVVFYYFMVYKKVKRGSAQPPASGGGYQPPAPPQAPPPPPSV